MPDSKKLLILTRYGPLGASSRVRFYHYLPLLEKQGWRTQIHPLIPDSFVKAGYEGQKKPWVLLLWAYFRRFFFVLTQTSQFDVIWIEKELFPGVPLFVERFLLTRMKALVLDYDDAIYLNYQSHNNKIRHLMGHADQVFAGSPALAKFAEEAGASKVVRVPTPVDIPVERSRQSMVPPFRVGWVGSPASEKYLLDIKSSIEKLQNNPTIEFHFMGVTPSNWSDLSHVKIWDWSEDNQVAFLQQIDLGLMPLRSGPWEEAKCSYKILLYFSQGIPALVSPVGMNNEVVREGDNGWFVADNWEEKIQQISQMSPDDLSRFSAQAFSTAKNQYSYDQVFAKISDHLSSLQGEI